MKKSARVTITAGLTAMASAAMLSVGQPASAHGPSLDYSHDGQRMSMHSMRALQQGEGARSYAAVHSAGLTISVPKSIKVYNKRRAAVVPRATVGRGVTKVLAGIRITVSRQGRTVTSGRKVRLKIGRYTQRVTVTYRSYRYVTRHRTVVTRTFHDGGYPSDTRCTVTNIDDSGAGRDGSGVAGDSLGGPTRGVCTSSDYRGRSATLTADDFDNNSFYDEQGNYVSDVSSSTVGRKLYSYSTYFAGYYTTTRTVVAYKVRIWTGTHSLRTRAQSIVVRDGGYLRLYSGIGDEYGSDFTTSYFKVPSTWHLGYAYDCSNYGQAGNWILDVHQKGHPSYDDTNLNNDIYYSDSDSYRFKNSPGTFRAHVLTECIWAVAVTWR